MATMIAKTILAAIGLVAAAGVFLVATHPVNRIYPDREVRHLDTTNSYPRVSNLCGDPVETLTGERLRIIQASRSIACEPDMAVAILALNDDSELVRYATLSFWANLKQRKQADQSFATLAVELIGKGELAEEFSFDKEGFLGRAIREKIFREKLAFKVLVDSGEISTVSLMALNQLIDVLPGYSINPIRKLMREDMPPYESTW